jgi:hypothetical protein
MLDRYFGAPIILDLRFFCSSIYRNIDAMALAGSLSAAADFSAWRPIDDQMPWVTFRAQRFLEGFLRPDHKVFEYGSGGSTLFFARRVAKLVSVEHDPSWYDLVADKLKGIKEGEVEYHLRPPTPAPVSSRDPAGLTSFASGDPRYLDVSFADYCTAIREYPNRYFDVVMVDGRARPSCVREAVDKIVEGGTLVLDNSDRERYHLAHSLLQQQSWKKRQFRGPGPYRRTFWETTAWFRSAAREG